MKEPSFLKLNRDLRRRTYLGLIDEFVGYSPDYMSVRVLPLSVELDKKVVDLPLPALRIAPEYTAIIVPNPELYKVGNLQGPQILTHGMDATAIVWRLQPLSKTTLSLPWSFEIRLMT